MDLMTLSQARDSEKESLMEIYNEAEPFFIQVEGRAPLPPLVDIRSVIPELPSEKCQCLSIYYLKQLIGYLWVYDDSPASCYLLHFYLKESYRGIGLAGLAVRELEKRYDHKRLKSVELVVSTANYEGLKFWTSLGFVKISAIYEPNTVGSSAIELELQKQMPPVQKTFIRLLPVSEENACLGELLQVTKVQEAAGLVLSVPEAIVGALDRSTVAAPYFIRMDNQVIGYAALVFDEEIPEKDKRYWLWQFMITADFQGKGYAKKALRLVIEKFRQRGADIITLSTKPDNSTALTLYRSFEFQATGEKNGDEIILQKRL